MLNRRALVLALSGLAVPAAAGAATPRALTVYKTASCGCCKGWVTSMARAGYQPKVVMVDDLSPLFAKHGVPFELSSCHMAQIGGYITVGHVPPADVTRLLQEKPKALGIVVPGMPWGSPGMEHPRGVKEAYETLLLSKGGKTRVFARHA